MSMQMPIFQGVMNELPVWPTCWPTVHRLLRTAEPPSRRRLRVQSPPFALYPIGRLPQRGKKWPGGHVAKWNHESLRRPPCAFRQRPEEQGENHTPSQYDQWISGWKPSMQMPISQGVTTVQSTDQVLDQWISGYRPDHAPSESGQRASGWNMSMQMPIFVGVSNAYPLAKLLANGPPAYCGKRLFSPYSFPVGRIIH